MANSSDSEARTSLRKRARSSMLDRRTVNQIAANVAFNAERPVSKLDRDAMALGIHCLEFHVKPRSERKHLVSKAFSQRKAA